MKYSEEEKKAIDYLENLDIDFNTLSRINLRDLDNCKKVILNLIEKQQKEIENQKNIIKEKAIVINNQELDKAKIHNNWQKELKENYVPKEAIREKIKQYESLPNFAIFQSKEPIIRILKELLGE